MPLNCSDSEQDLQILVDALCQSQKENRAGYDDVMLWLQDTDAFITKMRNKNRIIKKNEGTGFEFSFLDKTYHSKLELVEAYVAEWDEAKAQFFRGVTPETNRLITYLIRERNDKCTDKIGKILDDRKNDTQNQMNLDLAFAQVLHFLCEGEKENKFYWCGQSFGSSANSISEALYDRREEQKNHEQITQMLMSGYLSWKLSQNKTQDLEVLNAINHVHNIENMCITTPKLAYYTLMYAYLDETKYVHEKPDDLFVRISRSTSVFYEEVKQIINEQKYFASLIHQGYDSNELASEVAKMNGDFKDDLLRFYLIMESVCDNKNKAVVRQHYYQYGPLSYAYWIKENLDLYTFTSDTAETNAKRIKDVTISPSLELGKIHENMVALKAYCANLYREFQNNILLTQFGIMDGKSVYALHSDAFFYEVFLDETVPVGFKNYISQ